MQMLLEIIQITIICVAFYQLGQVGQIFNFYQKLIEGLPEWLSKPLGGCGVCFTGQSLFWYYLIVHFNDYSVVDHLFYPSAGIFLATVLNSIYEKSN